MNKSSFSLFIKLIYFFPLQLIFVHLKKNQQLLLFWLILFLVIFKNLGLKYGIPYLLLAPEYLGELSFASYLIVGLALGGFVVAFNISSYIMNGFRFPFLATLSKPFYKYCINNSVIPGIFLVCYFALTYQFLSQNENFTTLQIILRLFGFFIGFVLFTIGSTLYFLATNKDFEKLFGKDVAKILSSDSTEDEPTKILLNKKGKSWFQHDDSKTWRIESYLNGKFKFKATRPYSHYDQNMLSQVFRQNHVNASFFQISVVISIIILGLFREIDVFVIPAGASVILLFTMLLMLTSAIRSWTKGWTLIIIISFILLINQITKSDNFYYDNKAYGLNYTRDIDYNKSFENFDPQKINEDLGITIQRLENWKKKTGENKPLAVFVTTSGGGSRSAMWSYLALDHLNKATKGRLTKNMILGTGSSGGMVGMAYFREILLREKQNNSKIGEPVMNMGKDILNPIIFTLAVNDVFIRSLTFESGGVSHWKDRGYRFEQILNENTNFVLDKKLGDYYKEEVKATIPALIFTPSIINDSRRLLISPLPLSFMCRNSTENTDYQSLFKYNNPQNIHYTSVLRMTATFPYIMPTVSLPSKPKIEVFDSGLKDNFGIKTTVNYITQIKFWLEQNTSGILILKIKDGLSDKELKEVNRPQSILNEIMAPFGTLYGNWFDVQEYNNNELIHLLKESYAGKVEVLAYELNKTKNKNISLSWHLTSKEKVQVLNSITLTNNIEVEQKLKTLLKN